MFADQVISTADSDTVLGTIDATVGSEITISGISVDGTTQSDVVLKINESAIVSDGSYSLEIDNGNSLQFALSGLSYNEDVSNRPVSYVDAIEALKMSVGLQTVNATANNRSNNELEYVVADMTGDGAVNYLDSIQMLKASVGLELDTPKGPAFNLIDASFSDDTMDEYNVDAPIITMLDNVVTDTTLNLDLILTGDINTII